MRSGTRTTDHGGTAPQVLVQIRQRDDTRFIGAHRPFVSWPASWGLDRFGRRHGMMRSTTFSRARVLWPGTVLPSSSWRASRLMALSFAGR